MASNRASNVAVASALLAVALTAASVAGDTVELSGGGHVTGKVQRLDDQKLVIVQIDDDLRLALPASRVRRVIESEQLADYGRLAEQAGDDAERHYQLGRKCMEVKNFPGDAELYKQYHMRRAIALDPDHSEARASLNYVKLRGKWVKYEDQQRRRGLVRVGGQWQLPEAAARNEVLDAADEAAKRWTKEVNRLVGIVVRGRGKVDEAWQTLAAIEDPLASDAIARQLLESREKRNQSRSLRKLWIDLLAKFRTRAAVEALVRTGIDEPDSVIREQALTKLQEYGRGSAIATYLPMLEAEDNALVNRAAQALSWFPDPELALTYVEALVTTHERKILPGAGTQAGFTNDGSGGFTTGGKEKVIKYQKQNPAVLGLLNKIEPEVNHGYDQTAWRNHFASKLTGFDGDLRRDP